MDISRSHHAPAKAFASPDTASSVVHPTQLQPRSDNLIEPPLHPKLRHGTNCTLTRTSRRCAGSRRRPGPQTGRVRRSTYIEHFRGPYHPQEDSRLETGARSESRRDGDAGQNKGLPRDLCRLQGDSRCASPGRHRRDIREELGQV